MSKTKKFILFLIVLTVPLGCLAAPYTEVTYPDITNSPIVMAPVTTKTLLSNYIRYIFSLFVTFSGLICFGSLVWAGFLFLTSAGNPGRRKEAVSRIWLAFLGSGIVLGSFLIFNTINPQLVMPHLGLQSLEGVILYSGAGCNKDNVITELAIDSPSIQNYEGKAIPALSLRFISNPGDLDVMLFPEENYAASAAPWTKISSEGTQECRVLPRPIRSIKFLWQMPGVYLCTEQYDSNWVCLGEERWLPADTALIESGFNDNIRGIKMKDAIKYDSYGVLCADYPVGSFGYKAMQADCLGNPFLINPAFLCPNDEWTCRSYLNTYGAVLFEHQDYNDGHMKGGKCEIFAYIAGDNDLTNNYIRTDTSSIKTFIPGNTGTGGVWFCEEPDATRDDCHGPFVDLQSDGGSRYVNLESHPTIPDASPDTNHEGISSIIIEGNYLVALASEQNGGGNCNVFTESDSNLRDNAVGREGCTAGYFGCHDSVSSVRVIPLQGNEGTPSEPQVGVCPNPCPTANEQQCLGKNVQTCEARDTCNNWMTIDTCGGNEICQQIGSEYKCIGPCANNGCSIEEFGQKICALDDSRIFDECGVDQTNNCLKWILGDCPEITRYCFQGVCYETKQCAGNERRNGCQCLVDSQCLSDNCRGAVPRTCRSPGE